MSLKDTAPTPQEIEAAVAAAEAEAARLVRARRGPGDRWLILSGFAIAGAAAMFPWYVFFNQEDFGIQPISYYGSTRDLPETPGRNVVSVSPLAIPDEPDGSAPPSVFDPVITATVSNLGEEVDGATVDPLTTATTPIGGGQKPFRLLHVANGRALIEDRSGMYIVRIGSVLPDNSRLATFEERDGRWVIVTSNGQVITR